ncbi:hypothetical protein E3T54_02985 [Cryobacterium sp. Sr8]|uniref:hypothetical protein n=1 Tax=Cryobacterium sp. Sr8 TaxID=1259203 RepID=UPI00106D951D|nr:hypothetical protein [Cryobacterium sp. Sr8]TFD80722.1 hypothetical protein E3T54_02985 [Cryobacterium sp. Sr8]
MTNIEPPRFEEALPVQLTRMEGVLNMIAERGKNTDRRVDGHAGEIVVMKGEITGLQSLTQTLKEGAEADKKTAVALALALKEAEETRRTKTETAWSPFTKMFAVIATAAVLWSVLSPLIPQ